MNVILILGNQLFDPAQFVAQGMPLENAVFFMREDTELASYYKFHKHKIMFFFAAMRSYRDELRAKGYEVHYEELQNKKGATSSFEQALDAFLKKHSPAQVTMYEVEDKFFETRLQEYFKKKELPLNILRSPMFLTSRAQFKQYLQSVKKPFMKTFYERQRVRLKILVKNDEPVGGAWSFDTENRKALPKDLTPPALPDLNITPVISEVAKVVNLNFPDHPGDTEDYWLPVDRNGAQKWLKSFLHDRLYAFGPYEDALAPHSDFVFHSVLTPYLNTGLLTPQEVIRETLNYAKNNKVPLASLEGFIRQVIGWREFIRGIYQNFDEAQWNTNFWGHRKKLTNAWYGANTGVPPLDETLRRVIKRGYAHHIERLMVLGSLMLLLEVDPHEAHRWFMEMFVDSSDWVMGPNVFGMAIFSDGGIFATKPYFCGSNYLRKMGGYKKDDWCDGVDGLYWQFIKKHQKFFAGNPRLSMMAKSCDKISEERWLCLNTAADNLRKKLVEDV